MKVTVSLVPKVPRKGCAEAFADAVVMHGEEDVDEFGPNSFDVDEGQW